MAGVPFYLRTGKRIRRACRRSGRFQAQCRHSIFRMDARVHANSLVLRDEADEGVKAWIMIKDPSTGGCASARCRSTETLPFFWRRNPDALSGSSWMYPRQPDALMRPDEVEARGAGSIPVSDEAWERSTMPPKPYVAGSWGPSAEIALIERDRKNLATRIDGGATHLFPLGERVLGEGRPT